MMRVLHVVESLAAGGIETTFLNMLRAWRRAPAWATHDVLAFGGGALEDDYRRTADALTITSAQAELERAVLQPYDVLYFLFERCAYRLLPHAVAHGTAGVVYGKGYDMGGMFRLNDGLAWQPDESLLWGADGATFTTADLAAGYVGPAGRTTVLGKAADVAHFLSAAPPDASTPLRIVCVANLHARKRLGDLVRAVARLRTEFPTLRVRLVGADGGGEGRALGALARELGIEAAVELVGRRRDVTEDLAASQIFALPSGCEGVPTAMLEAMAAARPVVLADVGHIRSVVRHGVEGFLTTPGHIDGLVTHLRALLSDPLLAQAMGARGRARAREYGTEAVALRLRGVLEGAAANRARGAAA